MKKRILTLLLAALMTVSFSACARGEEKKPGTVQVVCTIFPYYDWVRQLTKGVEGTEISLLVSDGTDVHSYQATAADIVRLNSCDLCVLGGGTSEQWVMDALERNSSAAGLSLQHALGTRMKEEETVEGMEAEEEEDAEMDEHIWLSLKNAEVCVRAVSARLQTLLPESASVIAENEASYLASVSELDGEYTAAVADARNRTVVFGDRFPFRYLMDDYSVTYYAAFPGCSAETDASFETVTFLAQKAKELPCVLVLEKSDRRIAEAVSRYAGAKPLLEMDSMQAVSASEAEQEDYLSRMRGNLSVLTQALG